MAGNTPFLVKDCTLSAMATGQKAQSLREFRDRLACITPASIYYHFWGIRLSSNYEHTEYHNDFSKWTSSSLHDDTLAERLDILYPDDYSTLEELRNEMLDIIDERLDEREMIPWSKNEEQFYFIQSRIIILNTPHSITNPTDLIGVLPLMSPSSVFYHFIDAKRRTPNSKDDFSTWLSSFDHGTYDDLLKQYESLDAYFLNLRELLEALIKITKDYFEKRVPNA